MGRIRRDTLIGSIWVGSSMNMEVVVRSGGAILFLFLGYLVHSLSLFCVLVTDSALCL